MEKYISVLSNCPLFQNISPNNIKGVLSCLNANFTHYDKGQYIILQGDNLKHIGILITGNLQIIKEDSQGNPTILTELNSGNLFAETLVCAQVPYSPVSVLSSEHSDVILLDFNRIMNICTSACDFHTQIIKNMLLILAGKNIMLNNKLDCISQRSIRDKVLHYLNNFAQRCNSNTFDLPYNRQELADYLCVDRSALSSSLARLKDEGIINFHKNHFTLL